MRVPEKTAERQFLTPAEVAAELGLTRDVVLCWIHQHMLVASDVSRRAGQRPRWRIDRADLDAFLASRRTIQAEPKPSRRKAPPSTVPSYV